MNTLTSNRKQTIFVGIGEYDASTEPDKRLKTMALGSCVAVVMLDPVMRCVGMIHMALPESGLDSRRARELPGYFVDSGIPALLAAMAQHGCTGVGRGWIIKLVGGANIADPDRNFNIGKRNVLAVKKALWERKLVIKSEDIGKHYSRTVSVDIATGYVTVSSPGRGEWNI